MFKNALCIAVLPLFCLKLTAQNQNKTFKTYFDSIQKLEQLYKEGSLDIKTKINYAKKASDLSYKLAVDSLVLRSNADLTNYLIDNTDFNASKALSKKNLKLAKRLKDTLYIAYINSQMAYLYAAQSKNDSAFYHYNKALVILKDFKPLNKDRQILSQSEILKNIADLQREEHDYIGSQATIIKAIDVILTGPETEESRNNLWVLYNSMGLDLKKLKEYDKAFEYYNKALKVCGEMVYNYEPELFTKINLAELYQETNNFDKVFGIYNDLLTHEGILKERDPASYGAILNNVAYTMFLAKKEDHNKIDSLFNKAYAVFKDMNLNYELAASGNDMAEFYYATNQNDKALYFTKKSYEYGGLGNENLEVLRSLKMLSKLKEGEEGKDYLYEYIKLNDSLITVERSNRNRFARIQYQTDQYMKEAERLTTKMVLIIVIASILVLVLGLMYFIKVQLSKNKELLLFSEQEKANQEIYRLMLEQHTIQEEGRLQERHRIAEDLHDGVLSRLFGTRMGMGFLDIKGNEDTIKQYKLFMDEMKKIEKEVRDVSHELKSDVISTKINFESIIEQYIKNQSAIGGFKYKITYKGDVKIEVFNESVRVEIYRIIQETLQNIVKHAKAQHVSIHFSLQNSMLEMIVEDDGIGFDSCTSNKGIGLKNIASRLTKLGGEFKIASAPHKGTKLTIYIPVQKEF